MASSNTTNSSHQFAEIAKIECGAKNFDLKAIVLETGK